MPPVRILFLGTSAFAVPSLKALATDARFSVLAVITQPDKPAGRNKELTPPPVKIAAQALGLHVLQPKDIRKEWKEFGFPKPDFLVVVSYGQILSQEILDFPTVAPVNVHASLLPRFRGASPLQHAILMGDKETGVTVQKMVLALDAGPILGQSTTPVGQRETTATLHDRLADMGAQLLVETLLKPLHPIPQNEANVTTCRKLSRQDGIVDTGTMMAEEIDRKVRALTPWPGVTLKDQPLKLLQTSLEPTTESTPLSCAGNSTLHLITVQPAGKKPMSGAAWARGRQ
ncbi:MAG: methionyl-tRNA formyltransferase [Candidatus Peribacteraceae bacterium]|jgi:methionyl-tRNA formyltransferase